MIRHILSTPPAQCETARHSFRPHDFGHAPTLPADYRARLRGLTDIHHPIIEVQRCERCVDPPAHAP